MPSDEISLSTDMLHSLVEELASLSRKQEQMQLNMDSSQTSLAAALSGLVEKVNSISLQPSSTPTPFHAASSSSRPPGQPVPPGFHHSRNPPHQYPHHHQHPHHPTTPKPPKLTLQSFEGPEPLDWLFTAEQFFQFYQTPAEQKLDYVSFYMKGEALSWFKWMYNNNQLTSWEAFTRALTIRFGPSSYENHNQS